MKIEEAKAHVESSTTRKMKGPGKDGDVRDLFTELRVRVYLTEKKAPKWLDQIFPGFDQVMQMVAADEAHPGLTATTRLVVGDQHFTLRRADGAAVIELAKAKVAGKPSIKVGKDGDGEVLLRIVIALPEDLRGKIGSYCDGADVTISTNPQQDMFADTKVIEPARGAKLRKVASPAGEATVG